MGWPVIHRPVGAHEGSRSRPAEIARPSRRMSVSDIALRPIWQAFRNTMGGAYPGFFTAAQVFGSEFVPTFQYMVDRLGSGDRKPPWPVKCQPWYSPRGQRASHIEERPRYPVDLAVTTGQRQDVVAFAGRKWQTGIGRHDDGHVGELQARLGAMPGIQRVTAKASHRTDLQLPYHSLSPGVYTAPRESHGSSDCTCNVRRRSRSDQSKTCKSAGKRDSNSCEPLAARRCLATSCSREVPNGRSSMFLKKSWKYCRGAIRICTGPNGLKFSPRLGSAAERRKVKAGLPSLSCSRMSSDRSGWFTLRDAIGSS